jgi:glycosyltransferase involved in cell wall biosynthesis
MQDALIGEPKKSKTSPGRQDTTTSNLALSQLQAEVKDIRNQLYALKTYIKHTSFRGRLRRAIAKSLWLRLHLHDQYAPCEMFIPRHYWQRVPLDNPPIISIVTPSYNQGRFLDQAIRSVLDQNYPKLEYAVQDGGSKDSSIAVLRRYRNRLIHTESNEDKGQGNAINLGFEHATRGEIMAYLDSDDLLLPGSLNYVAAYFAANPDVDVVYGNRIIIDSSGKEIGRWVLPNHSDRMLVWANYIPPETLFWRRRIWDKAGGKIDESFQMALNWDLLLRFREAGAKFVRLPRFLGAFRIHESQKAVTEFATAGLSEMAKLRSRIHGRETDLNDIRQNMRGYMLRHAWHNFLYQMGLSRI